MRAGGARLLLALLLAVPVLVLTGAPAHACSCADVRPHQLLRGADAAFVGRVESSREVDDGAVTRLLVERVWSGEVRARTDVTHDLMSSACGIVLEDGDRVAAFASLRGEALEVHSCGTVSTRHRTGLSVDEVIERLGPGEPPAAGTRSIPAGGPPVGWLAGGAAVLLIAGLLVRRRLARPRAGRAAAGPG